MIKIEELFNLEDNVFKDFLKKFTYPYEVLPNIHDFILEFGKTLNDDYIKTSDNIWIHKSAKVAESSEILGPCIIMENAEIRHNAFLRENVIVGKNSCVGNSCEIKNSLLLGYCEVPHFNYVGDSILGNYAHLGAGAIISNLRLDKRNILIDKVDTHLRKIGAFIGDNVQIGCNSVINPGTIILPNAIIYPLSVIKGTIDNKVINNVKVERL